MDMNNNPPANNPMNNQDLQIQNNLNRVAHQLQMIITNNYMNQNDVSLDVTLKNGEFAKQSFDDYYISMLYRDGILHLEEMTLTDGDKTGFQIIGTFPVRSDSIKPKIIDVQSSFKNINLTFLSQFIPSLRPYFGQFTGNFNLGGTTQKTQFDLDGNIKNAFFGKITLGTVKGKGQYANK